VERLYSPDELAEILNVDPYLIDDYLRRSASPIKKDISYCRYDREYFEKAITELRKSTKAPGKRELN